MKLSDNMKRAMCVDCDSDKRAMQNTAYVVRDMDIL